LDGVFGDALLDKNAKQRAILFWILGFVDERDLSCYDKRYKNIETYAFLT